MKKRTIKQEARYYLQCQGYTATDQEIQRAEWRQRKQRYSSVTGWSIYSYLTHNRIAKPANQRASSEKD